LKPLDSKQLHHQDHIAGEIHQVMLSGRKAQGLDDQQLHHQLLCSAGRNQKLLFCQEQPTVNNRYLSEGLKFLLKTKEDLEHARLHVTRQCS